MLDFLSYWIISDDSDSTWTYFCNIILSFKIYLLCLFIDLKKQSGTKRWRCPICWFTPQTAVTSGQCQENKIQSALGVIGTQVFGQSPFTCCVPGYALLGSWTGRRSRTQAQAFPHEMPVSWHDFIPKCWWNSCFDSLGCFKFCLSTHWLQ